MVIAEVSATGLGASTVEVSHAEMLDRLISQVSAAQRIFAGFNQEQVDRIFYAAAMAANHARIELAQAAVAETGMGVLEDKVMKNHFASEYIFNRYRDEKTCGIIEHDATNGIKKIAEPIGVIAGIIPTTNPTATVIFKVLLALKTRNAIIFSPHPRACKCTIEAARLMHDAAVAAGAPKGIIGWLDEPTVANAQLLMKHPKIAMILATGGPGMVKAAYSAGKPAIGVGSGNTPAIIDETADLEMAISSILLSKTFDNGMICASEQSVVVCEAVYEAVRREFELRGAHFIDREQNAALAGAMFPGGKLSSEIVGQTAQQIAARAGLEVAATVKVLIAEVEEIGPQEPLSNEKLSPVLALYHASDFGSALGKAEKLVEFAGIGHTAVLYTDPQNHGRITQFGSRVKAGRALINMPSSQGAIGDLYNFRLEPSLTLGCGSWGGNSVSENVGVRHLLNIKTVAERRENMLWFRVPAQVYFRFGCLAESLRELEGRKRALVITDKPLYQMGATAGLESALTGLKIDVQFFTDVQSDPDLATVRKGLAAANAFAPDIIIAFGGGSPIDAAKIIWLMYEQPDVRFENLAMRFMDIRKRIVRFPELGRKALMVAVPTTSGTGAEVTPFAVITDEVSGIKYPIADYELTPDLAIIDPALVMNMPPGLTAASGMDAVTHALEALAAVTASEFTNGPALEAIRLLYKYLPAAYRDGARNPKAREKVHYAATLAGMAFANAFLGLCHSMAHKLGAAFHVAHGVANGILITHVVRYNATPAPLKQAAFPQYTHPVALLRYARVADLLALGGNSDEEKTDRLIKALEKLRAELNIPATFREAGVPEEAFLAQLDQISILAFDDQCTGCNPRYPLIEEIKELFQDAYYGDSPRNSGGAA